MNIIEMMPLLDVKSEVSKKRTGNILYLEYNGKDQCLTDWAKELNLSTACISKRYKKFQQGLMEYEDIFK